MRLFRRRARPRLAIIGLDCAEPSLLFERFAGRLPHFDQVRARGLYGELESVIPAITVPAWACMTSGRDPGALGVYGFRNRVDHTYDRLDIADARAVHLPRLWDILTTHGKTSIVLGVPPAYPPRPLHGVMVGCFLTPNTQVEYTYPPALKDDIARWVDDYQPDVKGFRTEDKAWLRDQLFAMTRKRFEVARQLIRREAWDLFMMVEIGLDRIHHGFWKDMDATHRRHDPASPFKNTIFDYYRLLDDEIGTLLRLFDDETHVLIVSDHGAKRMDGGICINEWLIREGYLTLMEAPPPGSAPLALEKLRIDWTRTHAWGEGGYYGRVFLNVRGREPQGVIAPEDYEAVRRELSERLAAIPDERGSSMSTRVFTPEALYPQVNGVPPDLLVYFGDLHWRSIGTVGWNTIHVFENDTGPDEANHAQMGLWLYTHPTRDLGGQRIEGQHLMQIAPTALRLLGLTPPDTMQMEPMQPLLASAR